MSASESHVPAGYNAVVPSLTVKDAKAALEFYTKALGAKEKYRLPAKDGRIMHAEFTIGSSTMMMSDEFPEWGSMAPEVGKGGAFMIYVPNADAAFRQAMDAGATEVMKPADQFYGDRCGCIADPYGYRWTLSQRVKEMTEEEISEAAKDFECGGDKE